MREILFRAKAVNRERNSERGTDYKNGDWVYGLISKEYDERFPNLPAEMTDKAGVTGIEVDYQSIGEYTGMNDKYGVRIFEGDIVKYKTLGLGKFGRIEKRERRSVVKYNAPCFSPFETDLYEDYVMPEEAEVIGNIYDSPELLESGV